MKQLRNYLSNDRVNAIESHRRRINRQLSLLEYKKRKLKFQKEKHNIGRV